MSLFPLFLSLFLFLFLLSPSSPALVSALDCSAWFPCYEFYAGSPYNISYTPRSLLLNGVPALFLSGSVHYPRSTPLEWTYIIESARAAGLNMIQIYTFWNYHQPYDADHWDFSERANITHFLTLCAEAGMFVNLRIGPYVWSEARDTQRHTGEFSHRQQHMTHTVCCCALCLAVFTVSSLSSAEHDNGGIPVWLHYLPGITFRSYNALWRQYMADYTTEIIRQTRHLFADRGGPIVLVQIENELSMQADPRYIQWCGDMANGYHLGVPILMCNGASANNTINSCNGEDCTAFITRHGQNGRILIDQPALWTETAGHFQVWGGADEDTHYDRPVSALSYSLLRWIARGGCHFNYYVFHGGTNFGTYYGDSVTTQYANGALLRSDGTWNYIKYTHLTNLHQALARVAQTIITSPAQLNQNISIEYWNHFNQSWDIGTQQVGFIYDVKGTADPVIFIESTADVYVLVRYKGQQYGMANNSIIMIWESLVLFNTSDVPDVTYHRMWDTYLPKGTELTWQSWREPVYPAIPTTTTSATAQPELPSPPVYTSSTPLEQLNLTRDHTEYMWYTRVFTAKVSGAALNLSITTNNAQSFQVWLNNSYVGSAENHQHTGDNVHIVLNTTLHYPIQAGQLYVLSILSTSLGISNSMSSGVDYHSKFKGVDYDGSVHLDVQDLTDASGTGGWTMRPYFYGETWNITGNGYNNVKWSTTLPIKTPLVYYRATFLTPSTPTTTATATATRTVGDPNYVAFVFRATGLNRGHLFFNGRDTARYWLITPSGDKTTAPTQLDYLLPWNWLAPAGQPNVLTLIEELGVDDVTQTQLLSTFLTPNQPPPLTPTPTQQPQQQQQGEEQKVQTSAE